MGEIINMEHERWLRMKKLDGVQAEGINGCMAPAENCRNPASYGAICVFCNLCGRFKEDEEIDVKKLVEIGDLSEGRTVRFAENEWEILDSHYTAADGETRGVLVLSKEPLFEKPFDEGNCNDWRKSTLRAYLNGEWLEKTGEDMIEKPFLEFVRDLTSDDGLEDYGVCTDKVSMLTCDEYRRYRRHISNKADWWWTVTPWSTPHTGFSNYARRVYTDGTLNYNHAFGGYIGVAPAVCVSPDYVVEVVE